MKRDRNKRIEIGLPEYLLSHAKVVVKIRGIKLDQLLKESLENHLGIHKLPKQPEAVQYEPPRVNFGIEVLNDCSYPTEEDACGRQEDLRPNDAHPHEVNTEPNGQ